MLSGLRSRWTMPTRVRLGQRAAHLRDDAQDVVRRQPAQALEALAEVLAVEELHGDVRRPVPDAVIEDLHDVRAAELRRGLGLALEAGLRLGKLGDLALDELDRAGDVEREVRREPDRAHAALAELSIEPEALRDDHVGCQLHRVPRDVTYGERVGRRRHQKADCALTFRIATRTGRRQAQPPAPAP